MARVRLEKARATALNTRAARAMKTVEAGLKATVEVRVRGAWEAKMSACVWGREAKRTAWLARCREEQVTEAGVCAVTAVPLLLQVAVAGSYHRQLAVGRARGQV